MCEGQGSNQQAKEWRVFCPKVFSGIGNQYLPDTLIDRSIPIEMKRKAKRDSIEKFHELEAMRELRPITQRCEDLAPQLVPDRLLVAVY
jgi:seryl-tRNA(Sec) selenium transferase